MQVYIVTYDITDDKRRTSVYKALRGWGDHLQYSVFRCVLSASDRVRVVTELERLINHDEDQVLFFDLGPHQGRALGSVDSLGRTYTHPERHAIII
jgi:CRISPR-associated protein Cas2